MRYFTNDFMNGIMCVYSKDDKFCCKRIVRGCHGQTVWESAWQIIDSIPTDWQEI